MSEDEFDEIIRTVRVARAEELKDQASRVRLEKLLSKFEKEWRKASGIKKTTITSNTRAARGGSKTEKAPSDEKIDEMQGQGHELKAYMQKEKVFFIFIVSCFCFCFCFFFSRLFCFLSCLASVFLVYA